MLFFFFWNNETRYLSFLFVVRGQLEKLEALILYIIVDTVDWI